MNISDKPLGKSVAKKNIIEIKGKRYDAVTGVLVIDGVNVPQPPRTRAKTVKPHQPQAAHTLMRRAVHKPAIKPKLKAQSAVNTFSAPLGVNSTALTHSLNHDRLSHARTVGKSHLIKHFSTVKAEFEPVIPSTRPAAAGQASQAAPKPAPVSSKKDLLIEKALHNAKSHSAKPVKNHRRAVGARAGLAVIAIAVVGLVAASGGEMTSLRLHAASAQAGFSVGLPTYHPAGYSLGKLSYSGGEVAAQFNSNSSGDGYILTQELSQWDSQALLANFVEPTDPGYQTVNNDGLTIYVYGQHNATWVNGGVWYVIKGGQNLTTSQLTQLATSL